MLTETDYAFTITRNFDNGISINISGAEFWSLDLSAPGDAELQTGDSFAATRWPFQPATEAGFDFSGDGRGYNQSESIFTINEVAYSATGDVLVLDVTFKQKGAGTDEMFGDPTAFGRFVFNVAVPEPTTISLLSLFTIGLIARRRKS